MVAYSFKPSFIRPIQLKVKRHTIRLPRKRHARPGEALQLFHGPRMKPVRIGGALCRAARDVRLDFHDDLVVLDDAIEISGDDALHAFAVRDGFGPPAELEGKVSGWEIMSRWWTLTHPHHPLFRGVLIDWGDTFEAVAA